jgi:cytochrome c-type biogenesis protein CcmH
MIWVILTLMATAAAVLLAAPFLRTSAAAIRFDVPTRVSVYREQLAEVDRELANDAIDVAQAEAARNEIKRRVLVLQRDADVPIRNLALIERKFFAGLVGGVVVIGGALLYGFNGNPDLASASRSAGGPPSHLPFNSDSQTTSVRGHLPSSASEAPALSSVDDMIAQLAQRMTKTPNDADGWQMLGWSYFRTDRFSEAAKAYANASAIQPETAALKTAWAEALIRASDGKVTQEALELCEAALRRDAKDPRARFIVGLAKEQAGDAKGAIDLWIALLRDAVPADEWESDVRQQTLELAKSNGIDVTARLPVPPSGPGILGKLNLDTVTSGARPVPLSGSVAQTKVHQPTVADVKAAESMSDSDRVAMIRSMVDSLQTRLDANPRDSEGWIKLFRSRVVLGEAERAQTALARALQIFGDNSADRDRIAAAAREAGLSP